MTTPRVIYLGVGTEKSAADVGGWSQVDKMGLKDAITYDTTTKKYQEYTKSEVGLLVESLQKANLVVGFNQLNFDYRVLSTYTKKDLRSLPNFDILDKIQGTLNFRVSRDNLAINTLNRTKANQKNLKLKNRVDTTKKLFAHGCKEKFLLYEDKLSRVKSRCDTSSWAETARSLSECNSLLEKNITLSDKDIANSIDQSIRNMSSSSIDIDPSNNLDGVFPDSPFSKINNHNKTDYSRLDQDDITKKADVNEHQHILKKDNLDSQINDISKMPQFIQSAQHIYNQSRTTTARAWNAYNQMVSLHGHVLSFQQFMYAIGRVCKASSPKVRIEKKHSYFAFVDPSGTLVAERVYDDFDIRRIKEEVARGI